MKKIVSLNKNPQNINPLFSEGLIEVVIKADKIVYLTHEVNYSLSFSSDHYDQLKYYVEFMSMSNHNEFIDFTRIIAHINMKFKAFKTRLKGTIQFYDYETKWGISERRPKKVLEVSAWSDIRLTTPVNTIESHEITFEIGKENDKLFLDGEFGSFDNITGYDFVEQLEFKYDSISLLLKGLEEDVDLFLNKFENYILEFHRKHN